MGLLSPAEMIVARVVSHKDYEREVLLALQAFGLFEFIDVTQHASIVDVKKSRDEETVFVALDRIMKMIDSLGLDSSRRAGPKIEIDDRKITDS
ncbi:MAG: hypothetical protein ACFFC0_03820, partial [Promethearchaeota archaeon]